VSADERLLFVRIKPANGEGFSAERMDRLWHVRRAYVAELRAALIAQGYEPGLAARTAAATASPTALEHVPAWARGYDRESYNFAPVTHFAFQSDE
jgi:hypothetical protein